jgi:hypothetical protein
LIDDQAYRYLSASIDVGPWVLRSVSLVNFPAVKGLQPVALREFQEARSPVRVKDVKFGESELDAERRARALWQACVRGGGDAVMDYLNAAAFAVAVGDSVFLRELRIRAEGDSLLLACIQDRVDLGEGGEYAELSEARSWRRPEVLRAFYFDAAGELRANFRGFTELVGRYEGDAELSAVLDFVVETSDDDIAKVWLKGV